RRATARMLPHGEQVVRAGTVHPSRPAHICASCRSRRVMRGHLRMTVKTCARGEIHGLSEGRRPPSLSFARQLSDVARSDRLSRKERRVGAFVYMLLCADESFYVGSATGDDLTTRVAQHQTGAHPGSYTFTRRPVTLVWSEHFDRITDAIAVERKLK